MTSALYIYEQTATPFKAHRRQEHPHHHRLPHWQKPLAQRQPGIHQLQRPRQDHPQRQGTPSI